MLNKVFGSVPLSLERKCGGTVGLWTETQKTSLLPDHRRLTSTAEVSRRRRHSLWVPVPDIQLHKLRPAALRPLSGSATGKAKALHQGARNIALRMFRVPKLGPGEN